VPAEMETAWGSVRIERGNPRSIHRDILDAILCAPVKIKIERSQEKDFGQLIVTFDCAQVIQRLGTTANWKWLRQRLVDFQAIVISVKKPADDWGTSYSLIESVGDSIYPAKRKRTQFSAALKQITFTKAGTAVILGSMGICLDIDVCSRVLALKHAVSRAIARWCLSHKGSQHHGLSSVLVACGCGGGSRQRENTQLN